MWCASQTCWCQSSQVSWNFGMHGRHVKLVKAHWHECSIGTMPTYTQTFVIICSEHCFASRPVGEASVLTHFLRRQNWRATGVMKVMDNNNNNNTPYNIPRPSRGNKRRFADWLPWSDFPSSFPQCLCCWCLQLQRSMRG